MSAKTAFKAEELTDGLITARELCAQPKAAISAA